MEKFYSEGYVCFLRASQMEDLIEESVYDECKLDALKKVVLAYGKMQSEYESKSHHLDNGLKVHLSLFSNQFFIFCIQDTESDVDHMDEHLKFVLDEVRQVLSFFQKEKVALEGGIAYDKIYHSGNINIGPAVVKAVLAAKKGENGVWLDNGIIELIKDNELFNNYISGTKLNEL